MFKKSKEYEYTLKRLIRGLGASTSSSRSGFYSTFIAFLCANDENVSIKDIFDVMQKELNIGKEISNKVSHPKGAYRLSNMLAMTTAHYRAYCPVLCLAAKKIKSL